MFLDLPLEHAPRPTLIGVGLHGHLKHEEFLIPHAWCLHLFRDPMDLRVDGRVIEIVPGTATLIAPGSSIEFYFPRRVHHVHVFAHFITEPGQTRPFASVQHLGDRFEDRVRELSEAVGFWASSPPRAGARLWDVLWSLCDDEEHHENRSQDSLVERARQLIELRLTQPLCVADLAFELGVSHNHLTRRFRVQTGNTVVEFIRSRRIERAVYLLEHTTLPIKAISRSCGLGDFHSFGKALRRATGRSPRSFRS